MYAAVPRIIPAWVMAGDVIVGEWDELTDVVVRTGVERLGEAEVEHLDGAVFAHFDIGRFQIAVDDPVLVRGFERIGDLLRYRQRFGQRDRATRDAIGERRSFDQLHHEGGRAIRVMDAVDLGDVRVVERGEQLRFALEAGETLGIRGQWRPAAL